MRSARRLTWPDIDPGVPTVGLSCVNGLARCWHLSERGDWHPLSAGVHGENASGEGLARIWPLPNDQREGHLVVSVFTRDGGVQYVQNHV